MARSFRRRRRGSSGRKIRKTHWESFFLAVDVDVGTFNARDIVSVWAKWPAGEVDDSQSRYLTDYVTNQDETWTRVQMVRNVEVDSTGLGGGQVHYRCASGLIAFEAPDPENLELVTFADGDRVPNPLDGEHDWIWRNEENFMVSAGLFFSATRLNEMECQSRAMRKLSKGVGVLLLTSITRADGLDPSETGRIDLGGRALIKNAG